MIRCEHCFGVFKTEQIKKHQKKCLANPVNATCVTCGHSRYMSNYTEGFTRSRSRCKKYQRSLFSSKCKNWELAT